MGLISSVIKLDSFLSEEDDINPNDNNNNNEDNRNRNDSDNRDDDNNHDMAIQTLTTRQTDVSTETISDDLQDESGVMDILDDSQDKEKNTTFEF